MLGRALRLALMQSNRLESRRGLNGARLSLDIIFVGV
jgi:hypothetical protein